MNKNEYIKKCGGRTSKDLSAEQILTYFIDGNAGSTNALTAMHIKEGRVFGCNIDRAKGIAMLRQAFDKDKILELNFVEGEGVLEEGKSLPSPHFTMEFRK